MDINLRKKAPGLRAVADIRLATHEDGPGRGQRILIARNATGVAFDVAVDRGFDISCLSIGGINIGWHSSVQTRFPASDPGSEEGWGFLRNFDGFMVTCGLDHISRPLEVDICHHSHPQFKTKTMPLHGRIATERARLVGYGVNTETGDVFCEAVVRQASVFGETLELHRRITLPVFRSVLTIDDTVTNRGFRPARDAILYHLNYGYPFLDENLEVSGLPETLLADMRVGPPMPWDDYGERVSTVESSQIPETEPIVLANPELEVSVGMTYSHSHLTRLAVWRAYQSGVFALGLEPRTEPAEDRPLLQAGKRCAHSFQLVLDNQRR
ncbi:aldose 1-epimerase family protein [Rhizobium sp. BT-226]|uniref:aldose 1-epimerase family protein n=1 Tax=Rhizobium sp. BT-226 TaxID=2986922 RepID=UPI0021F73A63|nr:aldose 1-epimerase family protein [Rhizobium sp. BT-226]MCW0021428.1 aldose 1-epimerase family protein [Rhizobium sp. BT-226]